MKSIKILTAATTLFFLVSCTSDNTKDTTTASAGELEQEQQEGKAHGHDAYTAGAVVETPEFSSVPAPFKRNISQLLDQYLQLKDALVASDANTAKNEAKNILTSANALPVATLQSPEQKKFAEEQNEKIKNASSGIANTSDIKTQREQMKELSVAVFALTKAFDATDKKLYYQHCPMALNDKGGSWLSTNNEIRNPYYGEKMLKCGSNVEELN